jgi:aminoglycoside 6'-N-acetyltransferase I
VQIIDFPAGESEIAQQMAVLLVEGFKQHWPDAWPDLTPALEEVQEALEPGKICRIAIDENGTVLGWVGAISNYDGHAWELHPLVVDPRCQGQGIGRRLMMDIEEQVRRQGGITIYLGTDDEDFMTTLGKVDLYPNPVEHILRIQNLKGHPYEFYQKLGYVIVGVIPDANGHGKPDIWMAKRIAPPA